MGSYWGCMIEKGGILMSYVWKWVMYAVESHRRYRDRTRHLSSATGTVGSTSVIVILLKEMIELLLMARWNPVAPCRHNYSVEKRCILFWSLRFVAWR